MSIYFHILISTSAKCALFYFGGHNFYHANWSKMPAKFKCCTLWTQFQTLSWSNMTTYLIPEISPLPSALVFSSSLRKSLLSIPISYSLLFHTLWHFFCYHHYPIFKRIRVCSCENKTLQNSTHLSTFTVRSENRPIIKVPNQIWLKVLLLESIFNIWLGNRHRKGGPDCR